MILLDKILRVPFENNMLGLTLKEFATNVYLFTANSELNSKKELVMGKGIALSVKNSYHELPSRLGKKIKNLSTYGLIIEDYYTLKIGAFQTKLSWKNKSSLEVVQYSMDKLKSLALNNPEITYHLNFPAIGNGGQTKEEIMPLLSVLPDNGLIYLPQ